MKVLFHYHSHQRLCCYVTNGSSQSVKEGLLEIVSCGVFVEAFGNVLCESEKSDKVVMFPVNNFVFCLVCKLNLS